VIRRWPIVLLAALLLAQGALVALLYWPQDGDSTGGRPLLSPSSAIQVDEIQIADNLDNEVVLYKLHGQWILPELQDLPADPGRIEALLETLSRHPGGLPAAQGVAARQRYRVTSYHYQRRLVFLAKGEPLETVYLGRSPAYRMVYARNAAQPAIYSLRYNNHDAPVSAGAWLAPGLLQVRAEALTGIRLDGVALQRTAQGQWRSARGAVPDARSLAALQAWLGELTVTGLADADMQRSLAEDGQPTARLQLQRDAASTVRLDLFAEGGAYYAHDSRYGAFFELSPRQYLQLMALDRQALAGGDGA
jgi:Domain of unknown function (DUF4340)